MASKTLAASSGANATSASHRSKAFEPIKYQLTRQLIIFRIVQRIEDGGGYWSYGTGTGKTLNHCGHCSGPRHSSSFTLFCFSVGPALGLLLVFREITINNESRNER